MAGRARRRHELHLVPHAGALERGAHVGDVEMHVDLARRGRRLMGQQPGHDLDGDAGSDQLRGVGVAQHVQREVDPGARSDPSHQLVHRRVGHRRADAPRPQVDEHVVGVQLAILGVHVVGVAAHQPCGHRDRRRRTQLGSRPVGVGRSRHDVHLLGPADEVGVAQPERLADPHPRLGQQRQQEPITGPLWRGQHGDHLLGAQGPRCPLRRP